MIIWDDGHGLGLGRLAASPSPASHLIMLRRCGRSSSLLSPFGWRPAGIRAWV